MRNLNLDQVHTFMEVVRLGSFSAAGRALSLSQPAISQQIKELEARLGVQLVQRLGKSAYATEAGKELLERGKRLLALAEDTVTAVQRYRDGWLGPVRIGTTISVCVYLLPKLLSGLRASHPTLDVSIEVGLSSTVVEHLVNNELDLGLVVLPIVDKTAPIEITPIRTDPMMALFPVSDKNIPNAVTAADLNDRGLLFDLPSTQLYRLTLDWFKRQNVAPKPILHLGNTEAMKAMVAAGVGIAILPIENEDDPHLKTDIVARPLNPPLMRELGLVVHRHKPFHPAMAVIRDRLMQLKN